MKIYVASSWRNERQQHVVRALREAGHDVYDFRNPDHAFPWKACATEDQLKDPRRFRDEVLSHPIALAGFQHDMEALASADATVLVLPCGRSAHLELGYATGQKRKTVVLLDDPISEPELMYLACTTLTTSIDETVEVLGALETLDPAPASTNPSSRPPSTHNLKIWPPFFQAVLDGKKTFELRKNDRDFQEGDVLLLNEWDPEKNLYTGRHHAACIGYVLRGGPFGVREGYAALSLLPVPVLDPQTASALETIALSSGKKHRRKVIYVAHPLSGPDPQANRDRASRWCAWSWLWVMPPSPIGSSFRANTTKPPKIAPPGSPSTSRSWSDAMSSGSSAVASRRG